MCRHRDGPTLKEKTEKTHFTEIKLYIYVLTISHMNIQTHNGSFANPSVFCTNIWKAS